MNRPRRLVSVALVALSITIALNACGTTLGNTAASPVTPAEASQIPCSLTTPIKEHVDASTSQATLDNWQHIVSVGCPDRQSEFADASAAWRLAAVAEGATHRQELITAARTLLNAEAVAVIGYGAAWKAPSTEQNLATAQANGAVATALAAYEPLVAQYGAANPDIDQAVRAFGNGYTDALDDGSLTDQEITDFAQVMRNVPPEIWVWNDDLALATWASYGGR
jgi:hypothetical protein